MQLTAYARLIAELVGVFNYPRASSKFLLFFMQLHFDWKHFIEKKSSTRFHIFTNELYSKIYRVNETILSEMIDIPEISANSHSAQNML